MSSTAVYLGPRPTGVSPSRVTQIETCPRQYQYSSIEKLHEDKKMETYRGTVFHAVLEEMFNRTLDDPLLRTANFTMDVMRELWPALVDDESRRQMKLDDRQAAVFQADVAKYIRTYFTMEDPTQVKPEGLEIRLDLDMGGFGLRGILDRLDRNADGELEIVDYKTGKVPQDRFKDAAVLPSKIYALLGERVLGERPTRIRLLYVQFGKTITVEVTDEDVAYAETRVRDAYRKITGWYEAGYFPPIRNNLCENWCSFKSICPIFSHVDEDDF